MNDSKKRILVVDDNQVYVEAIKAKLLRLDYHVSTAFDGEEALKKTRELNPDLILLDVIMPGMSGFEVCRRIKNRHIGGDNFIPIILVTAKTDSKSKVDGLGYGADDYLTKPFDMEELVARVKSMLRIKDLQDKLEMEVRDVDLLAKFSHSINLLDIDRILELTRKKLPYLLDIGLFSLFLYDPGRRVLTLGAHNHPDLKDGMSLRIHERSDGIMFDVLRKRMPIYIRNYRGSRYFNGNTREKYTSDFSLCIPLCIKEELIGVINFNNSREGYLDEKKLNKAIQVCEHLASAIYNCKLHDRITEQARVDGLTDAYNHRHMYELLEREFDRSLRYRTPLAGIMLDIDRFKAINDRYGHQFGDFVLKEIARIIMRNIRRVDILARYGGEEFFLILPQTKIKGAMNVAEKIRNRIKRHNFQYKNHSARVTVSQGVSYFPRDDIVNKEDVIRKADEALYDAKRLGRDCVVRIK